MNKAQVAMAITKRAVFDVGIELPPKHLSKIFSSDNFRLGKKCSFNLRVRKRGHIYGFSNLPFSSFTDFACDPVRRSLTCLTALPTEIRFNRRDPNDPND